MRVCIATQHQIKLAPPNLAVCFWDRKVIGQGHRVTKGRNQLRPPVWLYYQKLGGHARPTYVCLSGECISRCVIQYTSNGAKINAFRSQLIPQRRLCFYLFLLAGLRKAAQPISTKFGRKVAHGPRKDLDRDLGISNDIFKLYHCEPPSSAWEGNNYLLQVASSIIHLWAALAKICSFRVIL